MVISASPSLLSSPPLFHSLSFSFCFSLLIFLSVFLARPNGSLHSSSFFLVHLALERLFLPSPSLPLRTLLSLRLILLAPTHSFARSLGEAYTSRAFLLFRRSLLGSFSSASRLLVLPFSLRCLSLLLPSLFLAVVLSFTLIRLFRAPLPLPLFSLLVCFPLPVGNCTLSLLPSRRFPLVRICHCSSIRFRVFCLPPPPFLLLLVLRPLPRPVSLCLLSTLVVPSILPMQLDFSPPALSRVPARARQKEGDPGRRHRRSPQAGLRI